ncbi:MAG: hypothetical protein J6K25_00280 [Thermoguttaceae bacterium]|nr:hypothetical protein [Thermoguttaceae bacterium]
MSEPRRPAPSENAEPRRVPFSVPTPVDAEKPLPLPRPSQSAKRPLLVSTRADSERPIPIPERKSNLTPIFVSTRADSERPIPIPAKTAPTPREVAPPEPKPSVVPTAPPVVSPVAPPTVLVAVPNAAPIPLRTPDGSTVLVATVPVPGYPPAAVPAPPTAVPTQAAPPTVAPTQAAPPNVAPTQAAPPNVVPTQAAPPTVVPMQAAPPTVAPTQAAPPNVVPTQTPSASPVSPTSDAASAPAPSKRGFFRRRREKPAKAVEETAPVAAVAVATSQAPVDEADDLDFLRPPTFFEKAFNDAPGWLASAVVHLLLLFLLGLLVIKVDLPNPMQLVSQPGMSDEFVFDEVFDDAIENAENEEVEFETSAEDFAESENIAEITEVSDYDDPTSAPLSLSDDSLTSENLAADVDSLLGSLTGDELSGRGANKAAALASGGGTEGSEKSVALALAWLAEHQNADGSWAFAHRCPCSAPGTKNSPNAATAMAVLPFLAAGHTPVEGKYKENVAAAINFLVANGKQEQAGLGFNDEGQMYAHGLATIALCECYAMLSPRAKKKNRELAYAAQAALRFIENAQHPEDGGWRYNPGDAGDTSVVDWQMMALRSGYVGSLDVSPNVLDGALHFLRDEVGFEGGSRYYYMPGTSESGATDAIGLLCRLYLDWRPDNENLLKGVDRLVAAGPNFGNPYYNYYATQLAHHVGGSRWVRWNGAIRDKLIETQVLEGHERGSWFPENADGHCQTGGRLYATALNCLVLEVYYRHLPIHQKIQSEPEFDVDFSLE